MVTSVTIDEATGDPIRPITSTRTEITTPAITAGEIEARRIVDASPGSEATVFTPGAKLPTVVVGSKPFEWGATSLTPDPIYTPTPNPLLEYPTYTYNISLHMLKIETLDLILGQNALDESKPYAYVPQNVLISSGGRFDFKKTVTNVTSFNNTKPSIKERHPFWQEDFYFDEVKIRTVISPTKVFRGTNAVEGSMTVIEPNGFTFINRLVETANDVNPGGTYLMTPYMMQIDFFAMTDEAQTGQPSPVKVDELTKLFPIILTEIKTKIASKGAEYTIGFVPYWHRALNTANNVSPAEFKIKAKKVKDLFGDSGLTTTTSFQQSLQNRIQRERTLRTLLQERRSNQAFNNNPTSTINALGGPISNLNLDQAIETLSNSLKTENFEITGFCAAYNEWQKQAAKDKQIEYPDTINVVFDKTIGETSLWSDGEINNSIQAAANEALSQAKVLLAQGGKSNNSINWQAGSVVVAAGTIIDKLIEFAVRNSEYFIRQIRTNPSVDDRRKPLYWYKIIPRVKVDKSRYDKFRRSYATETTYYVVPYKIYANKHPWAANGLPTGQAKTYNYLFTGQNTDVLDLSIDFNMLYYFSLPLKRNQTEYVDTGSELNPYVVTATDGNPNTVLATKDTNTYMNDKLMPIPHYTTAGQINYGITSGNQDKKQIAASIADSFNLSARGDMINLRMRIIGDPDFIKQDDVLYNSFWYKGNSARIFPGGSFWMDNGELTVRVNINSPVDYDDETGLAVPNLGPFTNNLFSGIYKVVQVENTFYRGKFEQILEIVRAPIQTIEQLNSLDTDLNANRNRAEALVQQIKNVNYTRGASFQNAPVRSTNSEIGRAAAALNAQQNTVNGVASALASAQQVTSGLGAAGSLAGMALQIGTATIAKTISDTVSKTLGESVKALGNKLTDLKDSILNDSVAAPITNLNNYSAIDDFDAGAWGGWYNNNLPTEIDTTALGDINNLDFGAGTDVTLLGDFNNLPFG